MKKYIIIETVNMVSNNDKRPTTYLNQEKRVCEDDLFTEKVVARQAAVEENGCIRDLRTGELVKVGERRIKTALRGTVFVYEDGYQLLLTRFTGGRVGTTDNFQMTKSMTPISVSC